MTKPLTILAVDDVALNRKIMDSFIRKLGHHAVLACDGQEAVEYCARQTPDMILMDIMMPVMDGVTATRKIREQLAGHWIPIIFLSAMTDPGDTVRGLEAGGDDYLTKPVNLSMLSAKISVMQRIIDMQSRLSDNHQRLEQYYATTQQEQHLAQHVLERFNTAAHSPQSHIRTWLKPAVHLSGDVICVARSPSGADHVLLADSTGHGLVAALCCLPAIDTFHAMTQRGFGISRIAESINQKLHATLPTGHFVAAALAAVHYEQQTIAVWNGGIPCCSFLDQAGVVEKDFRSSHPPLGTLPPQDFDKQLEQHHWQQDGELIICSDGLTEAYNPSRQQFGQQGVIHAARQARGKQTVQHIAHAVLRHQDSDQHRDDASLVVITCKADYAGQPVGGPAANPGLPALTDWQVRLAFDARQLREQDCLSVLIECLNRLQLASSDFCDILLIVSELFVQGVDQGLLQLGPRQSGTLDDHDKIRRQRLQQLNCADVAVSIARDNSQALTIRLDCPPVAGELAQLLACTLQQLQLRLGSRIQLQASASHIQVHYQLH